MRRNQRNNGTNLTPDFGWLEILLWFCSDFHGKNVKTFKNLDTDLKIILLDH